ncbi:MAG: type IV pilus secretin PilQ [Deltaproteobacteria bacterium]|nr:type IV pilus secretin PilQ [Deltaproteobacteria bacterium]
MNRSRITQNRLVKALIVAFAVAVCAGTTMAAAPGKTNQIHAVDVVQRGSQTVVTVKGSSRPMYTAFKLSTPKRLVLDLANSSLKGVPALLEKSTTLVGGVAVSEFTTGKVRVSRVMINFRKEASYRVKVKGNVLEVTLSGGPQKESAQEPQVPKEQVISLANAEQRIKAVEKSADERVKQVEQKATAEVQNARIQAEARVAEADARVAQAEKAAQAEIEAAMEKAKKEIAKAKSEAANAKKEANSAKEKISSAQDEVKLAQTGASDAESKWRMARAEINKLKAKQVHYDAQLKKAQSEAELAQNELSRLEKEQQNSAKRSTRKISEFEKDASRKIAVLTRKVTEAKEAATRERAQRTELEGRLDALKQQLTSVKAEAAKANREKNEAEQAVTSMKGDVKTAFLEKQSARREAKKARDAQREAESAYKAANQKDRDELYRKLQQRQRETVEAKKRFADAENRYAAIEQKLDETFKALKVAEHNSKRADDARLTAEKAISVQRVQYERKLASLGDAVAKAESEVKAAHQEKEKMLAQHEAEKARIVATAEKWKREVSAKLKLAESRVTDAEKVATLARTQTQDVVSKIRTVEKRLNDANQTIVAQKQRIALLEAEAADAEKAAKRADNEREKALKRAELAAARAKEDQAKAEERTARLRAEAEAAIAEKQKLAASVIEKEQEIKAAEARTAKAVAAARAEQVAELEKAQKAQVEKEKETARHADKSKSPETSTESKPAMVAAAPLPAPNKEKGLTQEEIRLQRLAALQGKSKTKSKSAKTTPAAARESVPTRVPLAKVDKPLSKQELRQDAIQDIKFVNKGSSQKVVINGNGEFKYAKSEKNSRIVVMEFENARLLPMLERTLDVRDFGGVINSISSFKQDGKVRVEVKLGRHATNKVKVKDGAIEWLFVDAESMGKDSAAPLGSASRVVHREKNDAYAYPTERTAAYSVTLADLSQQKERYTGRRIDLDFKNADIHNILRLLADVGHVNIITSNDVTGSVTIRMRDVPWDQALDVILQTKGLGKVKQGNLIRVAPLSVLEAEYEKAIERIKMSKELKPLETRLIPVSYATAGELMPRANDLLSDRGKLSVDARTNVIIARDVADVLDQVEALIRNLDTQTPQVLIEGRIVEATSTYAREIGIQWGGDFSASSATGNPTGLGFPSSVGVAGGATDGNAPLAGLSPVAGGQPNPNFAVNLPAATGTGSGGALGISLGSISNNANLNLRLSAMEEEGTLRILSSPKILTLDNRQAHIEQGTMIPYSRVSASGVQTSFKEAKLNLTVTPHVTADGSVLLDINMTRDEPDFNNKGARGDPTILKREAKTELLVNDGHTAVIGGIFTRNHGRSYKKVPFFGDIPILGWLFKSRSDSDRRTEMLIFITPTIVNRAESIGQ